VAPSGGPQPGATAASLTVLPLGPELPPGADLASVLDTATGTTVRRLGGLGDFAAVSLRGSTFRQVEIFLDGVPLNPDGASAVNLSELPTTAFQRVDLYRGLAPVAFGSGAIGGVLNLITPTDGTPATVSARLGSFGTAGAAAVVAPRVVIGSATVESLLAIDQLHTEGDFRYFDDQGTEYNLLDDRTLVRENNAIDRTSVLGRARFGPPSARFTLLDSFVGAHQELPGPISGGTESASIGTLRNLLSFGADLTTADARWRVLPQAWWLARQEIFDDRAGEIGVGSQHTRDRSSAVGMQTSAAWGPAPWITGTAVVRARHERYAPYDLVADRGDGARTRNGGLAAVGADVRLWRDRITLSPALQAELLDNRALGTVPWEGTDIPHTELDAWPTPRAGVLFRPWYWLSLKGTAGLYLRAPDLTELFGDHGTLQGNPELRAETGEAWEVGLRAEAPWEGAVQGSFDAAYTRRRVHDLIAWVQNSQNTSHAVNVGEAYVRSTEGALNLTVGGWVSSRTNVTWTLTRNLLEDIAYANKALPGIPDVELTQETALRLPAEWRGVSAGVSHTWSYTGLTYTDTANLGFTAPRDLHSFALDITPIRGLPTVRAELLNAFDVRGTAVDRNPLDTPGAAGSDDTLIVRPLTDFAGYPLPGRTLMFSVTWTDTPPRSTP
jgi:iron complex outermembrane receptor protein